MQTQDMRLCDMSKMKILYYEPFSGISGDMNLAAMIDLGVDPEYLTGELIKLGIEGEYTLKVSEAARKSIHGTRVDVVLNEEKHHDHNGCHHAHRNFDDIEEIINNSSLDDQVKETSLAIFRRVAEAEAKIHGKELHDIHFHEVGATDSIVDIVGAALCYHALDIDEVLCSPIELGGGFVKCAHGMMPVPAPATQEILRGIPTRRGAVQKEMTTPTGAAILMQLVDRFDYSPELMIEKTAYGIGHRDTEIPNVLRVSLAATV